LELALVTYSVVPDRHLQAFLAALAGTGAVVAIDVPIGLAECEPRACDRAARQRLGAPRQNSVFSAPCRATLTAPDYVQACAINRGMRGRAISRQSWGIMTKIAAIEAVLEELPELAAQIWEAHPEVTFAELAATVRGISAPKKSADGQRQRVALLAAHGLHLDPAARVARGQAIFLPPGPPPRDACGRRMQIAA
jgi:predicted RNase H-like nuclease